jgi:hypothetical protein
MSVPQFHAPTTSAGQVKVEIEKRDDEGRVSLAPLNPEDVLRAMLATPPTSDDQD